MAYVPRVSVAQVPESSRSRPSSLNSTELHEKVRQAVWPPPAGSYRMSKIVDSWVVSSQRDLLEFWVIAF
jgi:hypothetical protein